MKLNKWTWALAATGVISLDAASRADEHPVSTLLTSTTLYGYVDTAAIWDFNEGSSVANRFVNTGSDRQDGFNLNAVKVALEKPLDEGTWSAGYKAELFFGPDAKGIPGADEFKLKQAYVALRAPLGNGLDFKIGRFDPIIGYEVADSYANPNFARSYGFALEPLIHTGVLATYQFADWFGIAGGVANTDEDTVAGPHSSGAESVKTYMASVTLKAPDSWGWLHGASLYGGFVDGKDRNLNPGGSDDAINIYLGASIPTFWNWLTVGAAYDYFEGDSWANAGAAYLSFRLSEQMRLHVRGEYAWSGYNPWTSGRGMPAGEGDELFGVTATLEYQLWANVITRLEARWDHALEGDPFGDTGPNPDDLFDTGGDREEIGRASCRERV